MYKVVSRFYPIMPWSLQEMDDIIFPFVRALKLFAIVLKACFYFKNFVSFRTLKFTLRMVLIIFFPCFAWALPFRPSDNLSESWKDTRYFSKDAFKPLFFQASLTGADVVQILYEFHIFSVPD